MRLPKRLVVVNLTLLILNELPIKEIVECNKIGLTSGASAPEKLVQSFISEIKKHTEISIEENISSKESVTFKLPSSLTS